MSFTDQKPRISILVEQCENSGRQTWYAQACRDLAAQVRNGMKKCDTEESKRLEYERDEPWTAEANEPDEIKPV